LILALSIPLISKPYFALLILALVSSASPTAPEISKLSFILTSIKIPFSRPISY